MDTELRHGLDETRRLIYMVLAGADGYEVRGTLTNALMHHHRDLLGDDDGYQIVEWSEGRHTPDPGFWRGLVLTITGALDE